MISHKFISNESVHSFRKKVMYSIMDQTMGHIAYDLLVETGK